MAAVAYLATHPRFHPAPPRRRSAREPGRVTLGAAIARHQLAEARVRLRGGAAAWSDWQRAGEAVEREARRVVAGELESAVRAFTSASSTNSLGACLAILDIMARDGPAEVSCMIRVARDIAVRLEGASASDRAWRVAKINLETDAEARLP